MKNLKKLLGLMVISCAAFGAVNSVSAASECSDNADAMLNNKCEADLFNALKDAKNGDTIKLLKTSDWSTANKAITINKEVTIDLNGKSITVSDSFGLVVAKGAKLTLTGSGNISNSDTASSTAKQLIKVEAGATLKVEGSVKLVHNGTKTASNDSTAVLVDSNNNVDNTTVVSFGKDVTVTSKGHGLVVGVAATGNYAKNTKIDMGGTWTTDAYVAKVNGFIKNDDNAPVINVNGGTYTSTDSTALYASGYGIWTINGTVKGAQAIAVRSGKVTVTGGTYIATDDNNEGSHDGDTQYALAILGTENNVDSVNYNDPKYIDVTVKGGEFTAKEDGAYAIYLGDITKDTKLAFTGGKYTSGEGSNGKQLPAMKIKNLNEDFLEDHKGIITGGEFASGLIEEIEIGLEKYTVEDLTKALTGAEYKTENGNTVVGNGSATQDPSAGDDQQPSEQKPSTGDNQPSENPKTFDAIGSLVTMAISSLGVVGTATKKYLR